MADTFTSKFRLCKPEVGSLDWHILYYDAMDILDAHVPRVFMSAPRIITSEPTAGGTLTENWYYFYKVLAMNGTLTTLPSWENISIYTDAVNKTGDITWSAVTGATKYQVYRADTNDPSYIPIDSDYNYLAEVVGMTLYSDTGGIVPSGVMPSIVTWYTTEIDQLYVMPDVTEGQTAHVSPVTLIDNLDNIRSMVNQINGQANWDDALVTNLYKLQNGLSGGQQITGGTGASENLTLRSTAHATKGSIILDSDLSIPSLKKFYLDGGSNTYIAETSADYMRFYTGGNLGITIDSAQNVFIESTKKLYIDGGSDTYIQEYGANTFRIVTGGIEGFRVSSAQNIEIGTGKKIYLDGGVDNYIGAITSADYQQFYISGLQVFYTYSNGVIREAGIYPTEKFFFDGGGDTYIYEVSSGDVRIVNNTVIGPTFSSGYVHLPVTYKIAWGDGDTYIKETSANYCEWYAGGSAKFYISSGVAGAGVVSSFSLEPTNKLYLDGGADTYISEYVANAVIMNVGGSVAMAWDTANVEVGSTRNLIVYTGRKIFLDSGFDTYIQENGANTFRIVTGGIEGFRVSAAQNIEIPAGKAIYLDGGISTYISGSATMFQCIVGGSVRLRLYSGSTAGELYLGGAGSILTVANIAALGGLTFNFGNVIYMSGNTFRPAGEGNVHLGDPTNYWGEINYKSLNDRGCLGCFDDGVELSDGRVVPDLEAICSIQKHPTKLTIYDKPMLDYSTFPKVSYKKAPTEDGTDGVEMTSMFSIFIGAFKEISKRMEKLEKKVFKL